MTRRDNDRPFIIDVEASGFGSMSYPIEVGVALEIGRRHSWLIAPADDWTHWDASAEGIHGITRPILDRYGRPVSEIVESLNRTLGGLTLYSDAWVVDRPWLQRLFHSARDVMTFDVSPIERLLPDEQMSLWDETKRRVEHELAVDRHRASHDAWIVQETYIRSRNALSVRRPSTASE